MFAFTIEPRGITECIFFFSLFIYFSFLFHFRAYYGILLLEGPLQKKKKSGWRRGLAGFSGEVGTVARVGAVVVVQWCSRTAT